MQNLIKICAFHGFLALLCIKGEGKVGVQTYFGQVQTLQGLNFSPSLKFQPNKVCLHS